MNWPTKTFLVLLRLAIGWHFFFEGVSKLNTYVPESRPELPLPSQNNYRYGWPPQRPVKPRPPQKPDQPKKPWTSEVFFREASAPFAPYFRWLAGDPLLDRLELLPPKEGQPADDPDRLPAGLAKDWDAYFDRFVEHHHVEGKDLKRVEG